MRRLLLLAALPVVAACTVHSAPPKDAADPPALVALRSRLAGEAGFASTEVLYSDMLTQSGSVHATVRLTAGTPLTLDAAIAVVKREVWHSALDPLKTMDITVTKAPDQRKNVYVNVGDERSRLQREYGPR